jgi:hypothetical protein
MSAELDVRERPFTMPLIQSLAAGPTVPERFRNKPADILSAVLIGKELGIQPMEAISSLYLVNGTVSMSGKLMSALVHRAGHQLEVHITKTKSTVTCFRRQPDGELMEVGSISFGAEEAKLAGLDQKDTYLAYPTIMWTWRAISQACRIYFADVLSGVAYVPEEVDVEAPVEPIPLDDENIAVAIEGHTIEDTVALENGSAVIEEVLEADVVA